MKINTKLALYFKKPIASWIIFPGKGKNVVLRLRSKWDIPLINLSKHFWTSGPNETRLVNDFTLKGLQYYFQFLFHSKLNNMASMTSYVFLFFFYYFWIHNNILLRNHIDQFGYLLCKNASYQRDACNLSGRFLVSSFVLGNYLFFCQKKTVEGVATFWLGTEITLGRAMPIVP